ncbi:unnamed protein product, partial [Gordionus sp. m RMFG-2023]
ELKCHSGLMKVLLTIDGTSAETGFPSKLYTKYKKDGAITSQLICEFTSKIFKNFYNNVTTVDIPLKECTHEQPTNVYKTTLFAEYATNKLINKNQNVIMVKHNLVCKYTSLRNQQSRQGAVIVTQETKNMDVNKKDNNNNENILIPLNFQGNFERQQNHKHGSQGTTIESSTNTPVTQTYANKKFEKIYEDLYPEGYKRSHYFKEGHNNSRQNNYDNTDIPNYKMFNKNQNIRADLKEVPLISLVSIMNPVITNLDNKTSITRFNQMTRSSTQNKLNLINDINGIERFTTINTKNIIVDNQRLRSFAKELIPNIEKKVSVEIEEIRPLEGTYIQSNQLTPVNAKVQQSQIATNKDRADSFLPNTKEGIQVQEDKDKKNSDLSQTQFVTPLSVGIEAGIPSDIQPPNINAFCSKFSNTMNLKLNFPQKFSGKIKAKDNSCSWRGNFTHKVNIEIKLVDCGIKKVDANYLFNFEIEYYSPDLPLVIGRTLHTSKCETKIMNDKLIFEEAVADITVSKIRRRKYRDVSQINTEINYKGDLKCLKDKIEVVVTFNKKEIMVDEIKAGDGNDKCTLRSASELEDRNIIYVPLNECGTKRHDLPNGTVYSNTLFLIFPTYSIKQQIKCEYPNEKRNQIKGQKIIKPTIEHKCESNEMVISIQLNGTFYGLIHIGTEAEECVLYDDNGNIHIGNNSYNRAQNLQFSIPLSKCGTQRYGSKYTNTLFIKSADGMYNQEISISCIYSGLINFTFKTF